MTDGSQRWTDVLDDLYGIRINDEKASRWERYISDRIRSLRRGETAEALTWAKEVECYDFEYGRATADKVVMVIRRYRKAEHEGLTEQDQRAAADYLNAIYREACAQDTDEATWNMLISPEHYGFRRRLTFDETSRLVSEYEKRHPDFRRPTYGGITKAVGKIAETKKEEGE